MCFRVVKVLLVRSSQPGTPRFYLHWTIWPSVLQTEHVWCRSFHDALLALISINVGQVLLMYLALNVIAMCTCNLSRVRHDGTEGKVDQFLIWCISIQTPWFLCSGINLTPTQFYLNFPAPSWILQLVQIEFSLRILSLLMFFTVQMKALNY